MPALLLSVTQELVLILQYSTINLGCHATGVEWCPRPYGQPFIPIQNFVRRTEANPVLRDV